VSAIESLTPKLLVYGHEPHHPLSKLHAFFFNTYIQQLADSTVDAVNAAVEEADQELTMYVEENHRLPDTYDDMTRIPIEIAMPLTGFNIKALDKAYYQITRKLLVDVAQVIDVNHEMDKHNLKGFGPTVTRPTFGHALDKIQRVSVETEYPKDVPYIAIYGALMVLFTMARVLFTKINENNGNINYCVAPFTDSVVNFTVERVFHTLNNVFSVIKYDYTTAIDNTVIESATEISQYTNFIFDELITWFHMILIPFNERFTSGEYVPMSLDEFVITVATIRAFALVYSRISEILQTSISILMMNFGTCFVKKTDKRPLHISRTIAKRVIDRKEHPTVYTKEDILNFAADGSVDISWATDSSPNGKYDLITLLRNEIKLIDRHSLSPVGLYVYEKKGTLEAETEYIGKNREFFRSIDYKYKIKDLRHFEDYTVTCNVDLDDMKNRTLIADIILSYFKMEVLTTYFDAYFHIYTEFEKGLGDIPDEIRTELMENKRAFLSNGSSEEEMKELYNKLRRTYMDSDALTEDRKAYVQFAAETIYEFARVPVDDYDPVFDIHRDRTGAVIPPDAEHVSDLLPPKR
jgi:hypothetical protein